jgi:hypothetical protein
MDWFIETTFNINIGSDFGTNWGNYTLFHFSKPIHVMGFYRFCVDIQSSDACKGMECRPHRPLHSVNASYGRSAWDWAGFNIMRNLIGKISPDTRMDFAMALLFAWIPQTVHR